MATNKFFWVFSEYTGQAFFFNFYFAKGKNKEEAARNLIEHCKKTKCFKKKFQSSIFKMIRNEIHEEPLSKAEIKGLENHMEWDDRYLERIKKELKEKAGKMINRDKLAGKIKLNYGMVWAR
jgi:hypothetical protein